MNENMKTTLENLPDILTPEDIADIMRISKSAVNRLLKSGDIEVIRYGSIVRIEKAKFREWLDKCMNGEFVKPRKRNPSGNHTKNATMSEPKSLHREYHDNGQTLLNISHESGTGSSSASNSGYNG